MCKQNIILRRKMELIIKDVTHLTLSSYFINVWYAWVMFVLAIILTNCFSKSKHNALLITFTYKATFAICAMIDLSFNYVKKAGNLEIYNFPWHMQ